MTSHCAGGTDSLAFSALRAQIEAVRVRRDYRGRGLGGAMFQWAIEESRRRGCVLVQLTTDKSRSDAHRFYERLGFIASHEGLKLAL
jgi:GNAT superfamily N-acetyltransferase